MCDFGEERDALVAKAVAGGEGLGVTGVFAPWEIAVGQPYAQIGAAGVEQGAEQGELSAVGDDGLDWRHAFQSVAAAQQVPEDGFCLVVGVVCKDDAWAAVEFGAAGEERMAGVAGGGFP